MELVLVGAVEAYQRQIQICFNKGLKSSQCAARLASIITQMSQVSTETQVGLLWAQACVLPKCK